jgi:hypothetical protein
LSHLLAAATNVIIAYIIKLLFVFPLDWLAFRVEYSLGSNNTDLTWFGSDYFKFNCFEVAPDDKVVSFLDWSIGILEVGDEVCL